LCSFPDRHADYLVPETPSSTCWFFLPPSACVVGGIGRHSPGIFVLSRNFWEALRNEGVPERGHPALRCSTFHLIVFDTVFLMAEGWATNISPRNSLNPGRITYLTALDEGLPTLVNSKSYPAQSFDEQTQGWPIDLSGPQAHRRRLACRDPRSQISGSFTQELASIAASDVESRFS
jgi:hypothetical protein